RATTPDTAPLSLHDALPISPADAPLSYLHGAGNIVPGLEKALEGKSAGDKLQADVPPEEGYGPRHDGLVQVVPRAAFQGVDKVRSEEHTSELQSRENLVCRL